MRDVVLGLQAVQKSFPMPTGDCIKILKGVDLAVWAGEKIAIVGKSGSGKSTLLNILGLLDRPSSGTVRVDDDDPWTLSEGARSRLRGSTIGFVFQQFHLLDRRNAVSNVAEPLLNGSNVDLDHRVSRAIAALESVGLGHRLSAMPHVLSGGEQQRVAIARALVTNPRIVLADEPTGALDTTTGGTVLEILFRRVADQGATLILVTHDQDIARQTDRVLSLVDGRLEEGAP